MPESAQLARVGRSTGLFGLGRSQGLDAQGMDIGLHQLAQRGIHDPVPGQRRLAGESLADHPHPEMTAPVARAGVACVVMAFILKFQRTRLQRRLQCGADADQARFAHGSTFRNGRTSTRA